MVGLLGYAPKIPAQEARFFFMLEEVSDGIIASPINIFIAFYFTNDNIMHQNFSVLEIEPNIDQGAQLLRRVKIFRLKKKL